MSEERLWAKWEAYVGDLEQSEGLVVIRNGNSIRVTPTELQAKLDAYQRELQECKSLPQEAT